MNRMALCIGLFLLFQCRSSIKVDYNWGHQFPPGEDEFEFRWKDFLLTYNKNYSGRELKARREIFQANVDLIDSHNKLFSQGKKKFKVRVNHFADLTKEEIDKDFKYPKVDKGSKVEKKRYRSSRFKEDVPDNLNWVDRNVVTPVRKQGDCASSYAISPVGAIEGQYAINYGELKTFSVQQIVDCSVHLGNHGCNGGGIDHSYAYDYQNWGLELEEEYPYEAKEGTCRHRQAGSFFDLIMVETNPVGDEEDLKLTVAKYGPVSAGIDASDYLFHFYSYGLYEDLNCSSEDINHAVLIVGYGEENGKEYWLIKNSWGIEWGNNGYAKLLRNQGNMCGIATMATFPVLK